MTIPAGHDLVTPMRFLRSAHLSVIFLAILIAGSMTTSLSLAQDDCHCDAPVTECPPAPPKNVVKIDSNPPDAEIWEDDTFHGTAPLEIPNVSSGEHTYTLKLPNYATTKTLQIKATGEQSFTIPLTELPKLTVQLGPDMGKNVNAILTIDHDAVGFLPATTHVGPGTHIMRVYAAGYVLVKREIEITADTTSTISLEENAGYLDVGTTNFEGAWKYSNLFGVRVDVEQQSDDQEYLMPHERILDEFANKSKFTTATPVVHAKLTPGTYAISLRPQGCEQVEPITQEVTIEKGKTTWVAATYHAPFRPPTDDDDDTLDDWRDNCYEKDPDKFRSHSMIRACRILGYRLSHRAILRPTKKNTVAALKTEKEALAAFEKACKSHDGAGCLGAAYLVRRAKLRACRLMSGECSHEQILAEGAHFLDAAFTDTPESVNTAMCWYRHIVDDVDPLTPMAEDYLAKDEPKRLSWLAVDFGASAGYLPAGRAPGYFESNARAFVKFPDGPRFLSFYFSGAVSGKGVLAENYSTKSHELTRVPYGGLGLDAGFSIGPDPQRFYFRSTFGFSSGEFTSIGFRAAVGRAFGRHLFELGTAYETMPSRILVLQAFGEKLTASASNGRWGFVPFLQYGFRFTER